LLSDMPFVNNAVILPPSAYNAKPRHGLVTGMTERNFYGYSLGGDQLKGVIKDFVMASGAAYISYPNDWDCYGLMPDWTETYYKPTVNINDTSHAVTVYGWDDNFPKENFVDEPPGDGAWLCKNSWGTWWSNGGYFWISYYSRLITGASFTGYNPDFTGGLYDYAPWGTWTTRAVNSPVIYLANIFDSTDEGTVLQGINFYNLPQNVNFKVHVAVQDTSTSTDAGLLAAAIQSEPVAEGFCEFAGHYTFEFDDIPLGTGKTFAAVLLAEAPGNTSYFSPETKRWEDNVIVSSPGQSFYSTDGDTWYDIVEVGNLVIRAVVSGGPGYTDRPRIEKPMTYSVTVGALQNGNITPDKTSAAAGETVTLTVTPAAGYRLKDGTLKFNGTAVSNSFTMPAENVVVTAEFEIIPPSIYAVTAQSDGNGTASASAILAAPGTEISLTAVPVGGYRFKEWQVIAGGVTIANNRFTMPASDVTVKAIFEPVIAAPVILGDRNVALSYRGEKQLKDMVAGGGLVWNSSNTKYVMVDAGTGKITSPKGFIKTGSAIISAQNSAGSVEFRVTVKPTFVQWLIIIFLFGWIWY